MQKNMHLRDLMFPDSNEFAFTGTLCTFPRKKSWHEDHETVRDCTGKPRKAWLQVPTDKAMAMIERPAAWATSLPLCPTPMTPNTRWVQCQRK